MIRLLRSGRFWLKFISFGSLSVLLAMLGFHLALQEMFHPAKIQTLLEQPLAGSSRSVRFDNTIGRSWLPRPTLTLRNLIISKPHSSAAAVHIGEMKVGLAWRSLFGGTPQVEKWVFDHADAELARDSNGRWSLADIWQQQHTDNHLPVNRLIVRNSRLKLLLPDRSYQIDGLHFNGRHLDENQSPLEWSATIATADKGSLSLQGNGTLNRQAAGWSMPQFHLSAHSSLFERDAELTLSSALNWHNGNAAFSARDVRLRADNRNHNLHLSLQTPLLQWHDNHTAINELNGVITAGSMQDQWDAAVALKKISLRPSIATVEEINLNGSRKSLRAQTNFTFSGPLSWQQNQTVELPKFNLSTLQDNIHAPSQPRFAGQLEGSFYHRNGGWQAQLHGLFDRQPLKLEAAYQPESGKINGNLQLDKLNLTPYLAAQVPEQRAVYPAWLQSQHLPEVEADIRIGSLNLPGLQIDRLNTRLFADERRISLSHLSAELYNGSIEGGISMANTQPPTYHLQQIAAGVQMRPLLQDLFGFHRISGRGNAVLDFTASGTDRQSLMESLAGNLQLNVSDGALLGLDIRNILRSASTNSRIDGYRDGVQTPFSRFSMNADITQGILSHNNTELVSDSLLIHSNGSTNLATRTLSESLLLRNARNRSAKPVPLKISGAADNPSVTIDYPRLTDGLDSPEQKRQALAEMLKEQWQWLNPRPAPLP